MLEMKEHRLHELEMEKKIHNATAPTCAPVVDLVNNDNTIGQRGNN